MLKVNRAHPRITKPRVALTRDSKTALISSALSIQDLISLGGLGSSNNLFVQEVEELLPQVERKAKQVTGFKRAIVKRLELDLENRLAQNPKGFGYLSTNKTNDNRDNEIFFSALVAKYFQNAGITPLVIPIDSFYSYTPGNTSLVAKVAIFNEGTNSQYGIILSGFSDSAIFTQKILEQVPHQFNAGLEMYQAAEPEIGRFVKQLKDFTEQVRFLVGRCNGDINKVLDKMTLPDVDRNDAQLLLAVSLLLADQQTWQGLWFEGKQRGTPLFIVAPQSFHDAMNRLNRSWGHGGLDYSYRADYLGKFELRRDDPESYEKLGLDFETFKQKVKPFFGAILLEDCTETR